MFLKVLFFLFFFMWIRWTLPRFRYDQLMSLGWKVLLPMALLYIMITAVAIWGVEHLAGISNPKGKMAALFLLNLVLGYIVFFLLDRGHLVSGSYRPTQPREAGA
jgi:NADH-quinone oxidoreductase subunit H